MRLPAFCYDKHMTFYICRHGETVYNAKGLLQGWFDTPLTNHGIQNAHTLAKKLKPLKIGTIISSDLGRAFMTAYIISRDIGYNQEIIREPELREVSFGDLAGRPEVEVESFYHHLKDALTYKPTNGEALVSMQQRVLRYLQGVTTELYAQPILLVTHDCVINALYAAYKDIDFGEYNVDHTNAHDQIIRMEMDENGVITQFDKL